MDFGFRNMEFVQDISSLTREAAASTFRGPGPRILCHYTRDESSKKIIATRTLWATCLTEQSDTTELRHGIALVEDIAMELLDKQSNPFVQEVLSGLVDFMRTRRSMLFITCFCGGGASPFHTETYGSVCFRFSLRTTRLSVCCRPEITSFLGQRDRTCRRISCLIGDDVRVIELVEAIHSFDESRRRRCGNRNSGGTADCCKTADSLTESVSSKFESVRSGRNRCAARQERHCPPCRIRFCREHATDHVQEK